MKTMKILAVCLMSLSVDLGIASQLLGVQQFNPLADTLANYDSALKQATSLRSTDGNIQQSWDYLNQQTQYSYDGYGRLSKQSISSVGASNKSTVGTDIQYSYLNNSGKVASISNGENQTSYTYTSSGDVATVSTTPSGGNVYTISYSYDPENGVLLNKSDSDGVVETYHYGINGILSDITKTADGTTHTVTYQYDDYGHQSAIIRDNGMSSYFEYDNQGRIYKLIIGGSSSDVSLSYIYNYDNTGNIATVVMQSNIADHSGAVTTTYSYNALNELESSVYSGESTLFPQDGFGNAIQAQYFSYTMNRSISLVKTVYANNQYDMATYNYDIANGYPDRLLNISHAGNYDYEVSLKAHYSSGNYQYDDNGNIIQDAYGNSYAYNSLNQMIGMTSNSSSVNPVDVDYSYYPTGEMASERSNLLNSTDSYNDVPVYFYYSGQTDSNGMHPLVNQKQGAQTNYIVPGIANIVTTES